MPCAVHGLYHKNRYHAALWSEVVDADLRSMRALFDAAFEQQDDVAEMWRETPASCRELDCAWLHYALLGGKGDGGVGTPSMVRVIAFTIPEE